MHFGDYTFILLIALVLLGAEEAAGEGRQLGKLLTEFRLASNQFKSKIHNELRTREVEDRKKLADSQPLLAAVEKTMIEGGAIERDGTGSTILSSSV